MNRTVPGWRHRRPDRSFTQGDPLTVRHSNDSELPYFIVLNTSLYNVTILQTKRAGVRALFTKSDSPTSVTGERLKCREKKVDLVAGMRMEEQPQTA